MKAKMVMMALGFLVVAGVAFGQTDQSQTQSKSRWENPKGARGLKLTDQEKTDIQKTKFDLMQKQIDLRAKIAHDRLDYEQLASADSPDEDAIAAKMDDIAKLQSQLKKNLLDGWFAVNKILTPDQQKIWKKVLQHPRMAARRVVIRMRGMRQTQRNRNGQGIGMGPMMNGGPTFGEELESGPGADEVESLGPMADSDIFMDDEPFSDDLDIFDEPMMDNMGMNDQEGMMGQDGSMQNRMEIMKLMRQLNQPAPDSAK